MSDAPIRAAGVELSLRIGQRVSHGDYKGRRVTGVVHGLSIDEGRGLTATVALDEPIVIPVRGEGDREIRINWQTIPAHELASVDDRDDLIATLLGALKSALADCQDIDTDACLSSAVGRQIIAAIALASGVAA